MNSIEVREQGVLATRPLDALVRGLASLDSRPNRTVSLYLDARWDSEQQRERARLVLKGRLSHLRGELKDLPPEIREPLERDLARADEYATGVIRQRVDVGFEGIAGFYCEPKRVDLVLLSHAAMPTRLEFGLRPDLVPLARSAHDLDLALVAVVETDETRILELTMGGFTADTLEGDVPDRVQRGGWRQLRIQKHIADHIMHHHRDACRELVARFDGIAALRGRPPRVVVGGREPLLSAFERTLPERVSAVAIRSPHIDPQAPIDEVLGRVRATLSEALEHQERELMHKAKDGAGTDQAALGLAAVVKAVNESRLRELILDQRFQAPGTLCTHCDLLSTRQDDRCTACGAEVEPVALLDELVRRAVLVSAPVHTIDTGTELADYQGVAALLRF